MAIELGGVFLEFEGKFGTPHGKLHDTKGPCIV